MKAPLNVIDILAILPYYIGFILEGMKVGILGYSPHLECFVQDTLVVGRVGKVLRLVRVMRILRVFKVIMGSSKIHLEEVSLL